MNYKKITSCLVLFFFHASFCSMSSEVKPKDSIMDYEVRQGKQLLLKKDFCNLNYDPELIQRLLKDSLSPNDRDLCGTPILQWAMAYRKTNVVKILLEDERIDLNARDNYGGTVLTYAVRCENIEIVKKLLADKRTNCNAWDNYGLNAYSYAENPEIVRLLSAQTYLSNCDIYYILPFIVINAVSAVCWLFL